VISINRIEELLPDTFTALEKESGSGRSRSRTRTRSQTATTSADPPQDLLVKLISPPADPRFRDKTFTAFRQQLIEQFQPADAIQFLDIDLIAADALHLVSVRQAMELITTPKAPKDIATDARRAAGVKECVDLLERLVKVGESGRSFDCTETETETAAPLLAQQFESLRQTIAEMDAENAEIATEMAALGDNGSVPVDDPEDQRVELRCRRLLEILLPIEPALNDLQQIKLVLSGGRELSAEDRLRWTAVLKEALGYQRGCAYRLKEADERYGPYERAKLRELAKDPVKLAVLHRVASQLEEAIAKRVQRLKAVEHPAEPADCER
jgi:hypothetical protein